MSTDPLELDAVGQAELVRRSELTPAELVELALERIDRHNPALNAVIHRLDDAARATAGADPPAGSFRGVPMLIKDAVCHTAGDPFHCGMRFLAERNWTATHDTELARRFRRAGFVILGRTNTPELATSGTTEPLAYGATRNPWALDRSPGGSSGGSAAAVAAGLVAVAHGNDMGGSIRGPAHCCGLVGLKPSRARTSLGPDFGEYWGPLTHEGVLTRSVRDTAAILDAIAGPMPGDPYQAPPPARPFAEEPGTTPGRSRVGLRTAVPGQGRDADPVCVTGVEHAARALEQLGHVIEPTTGPTALDEADLLGGPFGMTICSAVARDLDRWSERTGDPITEDDVEPGNWTMAEIGRGIDGVRFLAVQEELHALGRGLAGWWDEDDGWDLLLTPTEPSPAPPLGVLAPLADPGQRLRVEAATSAFLAPWNITGQPAISLPVHQTDEGLPVGVQLVARYGREDLLLRVAAQLEQALPWGHRRPPLAG